MFFIAMFTAFLERVNPDSTSVNPACIKNTKIPDRRIHNIVKSSFTSTVFTELISERFNIIFYLFYDSSQNYVKGHPRIIIFRGQKFIFMILKKTPL